MEDVCIFMAILSTLRPNGIFYDLLVHVVLIWYNFSRFGMLYREKSGIAAFLHDLLLSSCYYFHILFLPSPDSKQRKILTKLWLSI
jgi:hypothetical protein